MILEGSWMTGLIAVQMAALLVLGVTILFLDRKNIKQAFRFAGLEDALDAAGSGLIIFGPDKRILVFNEAARQFLPFLGRDERHKTMTGFFDYFFDRAVDCDSSLSSMLKKSAGDLPLSGYREIIRCDDGRLCLVRAVKSKGGNTVLVLLDMSELKKNEDLLMALSADNQDLESRLRSREAELFQSQKLEALGQLAAGVAHDFNNVLSIVDGYARMAEKKLQDSKALENYLQRICMAVERGAALTRQMLTFSHHRIVAESRIDLMQVVRDQEILLRPLLGPSINLVVHATGETHVNCAADSVGNILMNLVINARDSFSDQGGNIFVDVRRCRPEDLPRVLKKNDSALEYACLSVVDSGAGMDKATIERIFDPFFTTKAPGKGTGLGLSMVYGLVRQAGGIIDVRSKPGEGSTFSVYLPIDHAAPLRKIQGSASDISSINLQGYTALVAEDEPDILTLLTDFLEQHGMKVLQASNGSEALALQDSYDGNIDILITDVMMPEIDGVKTAELFLAHAPRAKIIFISGYPAGWPLARMEIPDDSCFLAKPVQYADLLKLVFEKLSENAEEESQKSLKTAHWMKRDIHTTGKRSHG